MKTFPGLVLSFILFLSSAGFLWTALDATGQPAINVPAPTAYAVIRQDANSRVWQQTTVEHGTNRVHQFVELATGLNYTNRFGQLVPSKEEIDILPNGIAVATNGQHQAYFPGDIYQGQMVVVTPDGVQMNSRPLGLSYYDGTNSVLIAELTNSVLATRS